MIGWLLAVLVAAILPVEYTLIEQRPDEAGAVHVPYQAQFAACCSAYSASTIGIYHPTLPIVNAQLQVLMTAHTDEDAVRLRVINAVTGATHTLDEMRPLVTGGPRPVVLWLDVAAWNARTDEHVYVLEVRGRPTIYGAKLRVGYVDPGTNKDSAH